MKELNSGREKMVNFVAATKPLLRRLMKLVGLRTQTIEIEPGTVMNFWVPIETIKNSNNQDETKKKPNKPVVVLVHGFAADGILTWMLQMAALAGEYAVYVPDLLFFGGSTTKSTERSPEFQAECLAKGLQKLGVVRCTVVGFSYGGFVGSKMAELHPNLVRCLVMSGSVVALTESVSSTSLERIGFKSWSDFLLPNTVKGLKLLFSVGTHKKPWLPDWLYRHYLEDMFTNRKERAELLNTLVVSDKDNTTLNFSQKIYLLVGEGDKIFNLDVAHNMKVQLGNKVTVIGITKAGHLVQLERPCVYNRHLKKILQSLEADRS